MHSENAHSVVGSSYIISSVFAFSMWMVYIAPMSRMSPTTKDEHIWHISSYLYFSLVSRSYTSTRPDLSPISSHKLCTLLMCMILSSKYLQMTSFDYKWGSTSSGSTKTSSSFSPAETLSSYVICSKSSMWLGSFSTWTWIGFSYCLAIVIFNSYSSRWSASVSSLWRCCVFLSSWFC